ncbi:MAG: hypothetical protein H7Z41_04745 [Cytophagales bacterium]|nr:hypothetical protein [Armatimonadota bacterium]
MDNKNQVVNPDFETDLHGWSREGAVRLDTAIPLEGKGSACIGPGKGAIRQRFEVGGLKTLYLSARLKAASPDVEAKLRVQCYDAHNRLVLDLGDPLIVNKSGTKENDAHLYFKTHAFTTTMVISIEKTRDTPGKLYVDKVSRFDLDRSGQAARPLCDLDQYLQPIWKGRTVYNETVLFFSPAGKPAVGTLMFTPDRILSVRDYSLGITFTPGTDYTLGGNVLTRTADSKLPFLKESDLPSGEQPWLGLTSR